MRAERCKRVEFLLDPKYPNEKAAIDYLESLPHGQRSGYCRQVVLKSISGQPQQQIKELQNRVEYLESLLERLSPLLVAAGLHKEPQG